jgi:DNA polymerase III epsilon subunit family exonuclease
MSEKWYASGPFTIFDVETTGLSAVKNRIVEIAGIRIALDGSKTRFQSLVNPECRIPYYASKVHKITDKDVQGEPTFAEVGRKFLDFIAGSILVAHNAKFDLSFLQESLNRYGLPLWDGKTMDSIQIIRIAYPNLPSYSLQNLRHHFGLGANFDGPAHRAFADVEWTEEIFAMAMQGLIDSRG